jgi:hypothetical protein
VNTQLALITIYLRCRFIIRDAFDKIARRHVMLAVKTGQLWDVFDPTVGYWDRAVVVAVDNDRVTLRHQGSVQKVVGSVDDLDHRPERYRFVADARSA